MTEIERALFSDLAWFAPDHDFLAPEITGLRPLSLATWKAMELTQIILFADEPRLSLEEEMRQIAAYIWLHTAPIPTIGEALWSGAWRAVYSNAPAPSEQIIHLFRAHRQRNMDALSAACFRIRPRSSSAKHDDTPKDVIGPQNLAFTIALLRRATRASAHEILWLTWLPQMLQTEHAELRWNGAWTVRPSVEIKEEDLANAWPEFLNNPQLSPPIE